MGHSTIARCVVGPWPIPGATPAPGDVAAVYLSEQGTTVFLIVTHPGHRAIPFAGTVTTTGTLSVVQEMLEPEDTFSVSADQKTLTFNFIDHGQLDGIAFTMTCGHRLTFDVTDQGAPAQIMGVKTGGQPQTSPVTIKRSG